MPTKKLQKEDKITRKAIVDYAFALQQAAFAHPKTDVEIEKEGDNWCLTIGKFENWLRILVSHREGVSNYMIVDFYFSELDDKFMGKGTISRRIFEIDWHDKTFAASHGILIPVVTDLVLV